MSTAVVVSTDCVGCGHAELAHADRALAPQCSTPGCICLRYRPSTTASAPAASSVAQAICRCHHGARLHERDDASPYGRGICMQRSCGCSEYRPADAVHVDVPARPEPGDDVAVEAVQPVERPSSPVAKSEVSPPAPVLRPRTEAMLPCPAAGCDREFSRANGLTRHLRESHAAGATETRADAGSPSPEPDQPEPRASTARGSVDAPERTVVPDTVLAAPLLEDARDGVKDGGYSLPISDEQAADAEALREACEQAERDIQEHDMAETPDVVATEPADTTRTIRSLTAHLEYFDAELSLSSTLDLNLANVGPLELQAITAMVLQYLTGGDE